jgi:hypothetical protein
MTMLVEGLQASDHDDVMQSERAAQFHSESTTQAGAVRTHTVNAVRRRR